MNEGDKIQVKPSSEYLTACSMQKGTIIKLTSIDPEHGQLALINFPGDGEIELPIKALNKL